MSPNEINAQSFHTLKHILLVRKLLDMFIVSLIERGQKHDASKLEPPEVESFAEHTPKLAQMEYNSPEYKESLALLNDALLHHYANNRHHPEHFKNGVNDMNLLDIIEFFCDIYAASKRQKDGNIRKSLDVAANRFGLNPQLVKILENSIGILEEN